MFKAREFRKAHELLQSNLAEILGVSQSAISRIEAGDIDVTPRQLQILCDTYGKEEISKYFDDEPLNSEKEDAGLVELLTRQAGIIERQINEQNETTRQVISINERLLELIEKLSFE